MLDLSVKLGKTLTLKNPLVAGAGPTTGTVQHIENCVDAGFGAVVTKTASVPWHMQRFPRPLYTLVDYKKNPQDPYYVPEDYTWMHRDHNSVYPLDKFPAIIKVVAPYCREHGTVLIGSIAGRSMEEWETAVKAYAEAGADALELNFCCPFPPEGLVKKPEDAHMGIYFTYNHQAAAEVVRHVKKVVDIPIFCKLSPDGSNFVEIAQELEKAGADGVTMFANNNILRIDVETGKPINYGPCAGSGPWALGHSLRWCAMVAKGTNDLAVMGGRGATDWRGAVEFLLGGSNAIQLSHSIMIRGLGYVKEILAGIETYMKRHGYETIADFQGKSLNEIYTNQEMMDKVKALYAKVNYDKCIGCGRCSQVCFYDAMKFYKKAVVKAENCAGCTLCKNVCPVNAIDMIERDNDIDYLRALSSAHPELAPDGVWDTNE